MRAMLLTTIKRTIGENLYFSLHNIVRPVVTLASTNAVGSVLMHIARVVQTAMYICTETFAFAVAAYFFLQICKEIVASTFRNTVFSPKDFLNFRENVEEISNRTNGKLIAKKFVFLLYLNIRNFTTYCMCFLAGNICVDPVFS